jgi:hypothetical protein
VKRPVLLISLAILFILCEALIFLPDYESPAIVELLIVSQVMFGLSLFIFFVARKYEFETRHRRLFIGLLIMALTARVVMLVGTDDKFYLSDDIYRYVWDGKVSADGLNPFIYTPQDTEVAHLVDSTIHPNINFPWMPTIYPPMAQNVFLVTYLIGGDGTWGFKLVSVIFELLTVIALAAWLRMMNIPRANLLLWLFSPLILIEFYLSAHLDILAMPFLVGTLIAMSKERPSLAGILLAMATLIKFYGLFFAPFLFLHFAGRNRFKFAVGFTAALVALYLPYTIGAGTAVFGSLFKYLADWQFNGSVFILLKYVLGLTSARVIVAVAFLGWLTWLLFRRWQVLDKMHAAFGGYLVLTTTFFPWYFVWIFPFVLRNLSAAFLFLSGSVLLSYHVLIGHYAVGKWIAIPWLVIVSYVPFFGLLLIEAVRQWRLKVDHA